MQISSSNGSAPTAAPPEHVDVLIIGAGLSGVGAACHLQHRCPDKTFAILEARDAIGGTWDLFRYPGIRSDSDMYTLGYRFRPWEDAKAIADGPSILQYIRDTARDNRVEEKIRFGHRVVRAEWSSEDSMWTVEVQRTNSPENVRLSCRFLFACTGYYRYDEGYLPAFEGTERFGGEVVHPQHWPEDLDYSGKRVVVVGSGATAVTLVPAMAEHASHVTMLQRSPTYIVSLPSEDPFATAVRRRLSPKRAYAVTRWKNVIVQWGFFQLSRRRPELIKRFLRHGVQRQLPAGFDIDTHFTPRYNPWDQRVCLVPDGDLFRAIAEGRASVITDGIESFTENGLKLSSGAELEADVVVSATGLNLLVLGGMELSVDGREISIPDAVGYKGMMLSGVPNLALALGYTNASWTLKCDLTCEYVCRMIKHMDAHGYTRALPCEPDASVGTGPFLDLASGYVMRSLSELPKQGDRAPWRLHQNYPLDIRLLRHGPIEDKGIEFSGDERRSRGGAPAPGAPEPAAA